MKYDQIDGIDSFRQDALEDQGFVPGIDTNTGELLFVHVNRGAVEFPVRPNVNPEAVGTAYDCRYMPLDAYQAMMAVELNGDDAGEPVVMQAPAGILTKQETPTDE